MHTDPLDQEGPNLYVTIEMLGLEENVFISNQRIEFEHMNVLHNITDFCINIALNEGFGLATLESLSCGTPIIVNMTGGLQEQVTDGNNEFGIPIFPTSKSVIGSQQVPYIYEDRISKKQFHSALNKIYKMGQENRRQLGMDGRQHVLDNYNFLNFEKQWVETMDSVYEKKNNRDVINIIRFKEVA